MSEQENAPQNQKNKARRRLLKGIVAGGGTIAAGASLPERWTRPVVEAVSLPAHAQTTGESGPGLDDLSPWESGEQNFIAGGPEDTERFASLDSQSDTPDWDALSDNEILDFFTRPAHAGGTINATSFYNMWAETDGDVGRLCLDADLDFETETLAFFAFLHSNVQGDAIKGGNANVSINLGSTITDGVDVEFSDFVRAGNNLQGRFELFINSVSRTEQSVTLTPGGSGCEPAPK